MSRPDTSHRAASLAAAILTLTTGCLPLRACFGGMDRPAALNDVGVRVGGEWLARDTFREDARLGSVTQIVRRKTGELAIVGTQAAVFLAAQGGPPRVVTFRPEAHEVELVEWASGSPRYIDRGGGGWQTGAQFSPVAWPPGQPGLLHAHDDGAQVVGFDGKTRARLATPDSSFLMDAHGAAARFDGGDYLVLTLSMSGWDRTQLVVFDGSGKLRYREVVAGTCTAVAAPQPEAFLFGCGRAVLRYAVRR